MRLLPTIARGCEGGQGRELCEDRGDFQLAQLPLEGKASRIVLVDCPGGQVQLLHPVNTFP